MILEWGTLLRYSGEGFENSHKYHGAYIKRATNNGGSSNPMSQIHSLLYWQSRKMLACIETKGCWGKLKLRIHQSKPEDFYKTLNYISFRDIY